MIGNLVPVSAKPHLALHCNSMKRNQHIFLLSLFGVLLFGIALSAYGADEFQPDRLITYKTVGDVELKLHAFFPEDYQDSDRRPAIVFFYGGGWNNGNPRQFYEHARLMNQHGMVAFAAEYRIKSKHKTTPFECVEDGKSAIRWVRANAAKLGIDPDRIVSAGGSAGGHVAACTGMIQGLEKGDNVDISSVPNAMVLFNPVLDTTKKGFGAGRFSDEQKTALSPCHHVRAGIVPTVLFHGTADKTVPFENAERFARLMKEAGNNCELVSYKDQGHGFFNGPHFRNKSDGIYYGKTTKRAIAFLKGLKMIDSDGPAEPAPKPETASRPNIIFIMADDLGYGDLSHAGGKVPTPHCDRLAKEGVRFTDAHTSSAVCTPTRYGILTGRYNWRSRMKKSVLGGFSKPLIPTDRTTIANFLGDQNYHTAVVGKWHLGIGWEKLPNGEKRTPEKRLIDPEKAGKNSGKVGWDIDYSKPAITPVHNGFDSFFGIAASLDMPPYVYIENDRAAKIPTVVKAFAKPYRPGPASESFEANRCLRDFASRSRQVISEQAADKSKPFFLYLPLTSPHTPIVPAEKWKDRSGLSSYGDFLMESDWVVGEVLAELDKQGIADNTLVIFTSDNGCSPMAKIEELTEKGHKPNGDWRGHKADIFEGGHRVPFLVRWPGRAKAGSLSAATICTTDFFATAAEAIGASDSITDSMAEDSHSFLGDLTGEGSTARTTTIHHSINGSFAIRKGQWKLNLCPGSGGWSSPKPGKKTRGMPLVQLYNLADDPGETTNLQDQFPEQVEGLVQQLAKEITTGRSTPGTPQSNEGEIPFPKPLLKRFPMLEQ